MCDTLKRGRVGAPWSLPNEILKILTADMRGYDERRSQPKDTDTRTEEQQQPQRPATAHIVSDVVLHSLEACHAPQDWADGMANQAEKNNGKSKCAAKRLVFTLDSFGSVATKVCIRNHPEEQAQYRWGFTPPLQCHGWGPLCHSHPATDLKARTRVPL